MSQESTLQMLERKMVLYLPRKFVKSVMMALRYEDQPEKVPKKDIIIIGSDEQDDDDGDEDVQFIDIQRTMVSDLKACLDVY